MSRMSEFNSKFGGGATIAMPRIRYLSAYANSCRNPGVAGITTV